jgi:Bacterial regulatory protein, arsR family
VKRLDPDDPAAIDRAGRRCAVCRTGRRWRKFAVVRPDGGEPVIMCAACRARYGDAPPAPPARERPDAFPARAAEPMSTILEGRAPEGEDRVRRVVRELPKGEYTTGSIAKAAGLNQSKTLRRLRQLAESGEIREVGKRWSTERPPSDIDEALDRLQARTSNIRIVRDRSLVG